MSRVPVRYLHSKSLSSYLNDLFLESWNDPTHSHTLADTWFLH